MGVDEYDRELEADAEIAASYDCRWWEEGWNALRAEAGLPELELAPLPDPVFIEIARETPQIGFFERGRQRWLRGQ